MQKWYVICKPHTKNFNFLGVEWAEGLDSNDILFCMLEAIHLAYCWVFIKLCSECQGPLNIWLQNVILSKLFSYSSAVFMCS